MEVDHGARTDPGPQATTCDIMTRIHGFIAGSLALSAALCGVGPRAASAADAGIVAPQDFAFFHENVLGTSCEIRVRAESPEAARRAEGRVLDEVDRLAAIF